MQNRFGVIDLGTNTFHLLIVDKSPQGGFTEIHRERRFIKLAEEGIEQIGKAAFQRGIQAILDYKETLTQYQVQQVSALGTAALRTADNGQDFIDEVLEKTGIPIELISGEREAQLICQGVSLAIPFDDAPMLIMDIGGGSVEFIIANNQKVYWAQSFPVGVAILYKKFHRSDPISAHEVDFITDYLHSILHPLKIQVRKYLVNTLIGASGTFDVLETMIVKEKANSKFSHFSVEEYYPLHKRLLKTSLAERLQLRDLPPMRADMIIVAMILIHFVLEISTINRIVVSAYAMKEGKLAEMMQAMPS